MEQAISNIAMSSGGGGEVNLRWLDDVDYTTIADGLFLRYSAEKKKFEFAVGGGGGSASITVANTAPTTNTSGSMWWNTDDGSLYIYYVDETSSQWVPAAPAGKTGVVAVTSPLTYDSANSTIGMSGSPIMNTANTPVGIGSVANSTSLLTLSDTNLAVSANGSALVINQRWNTTGNPTAFKINANNILSGSTTKLMDLQVDGASKFNVDKNGILTLASGIVTPTTTINFNLSNVYTGGVLADGANGVQIRGSQSGAGLGFGINGVSDTFVYRDSTSGILAQRNGTANQTFRLYNTIDNANTANFERASLSFVSYSGAVYTKLSSESGGTGNTNIGLALVPKGTGAVTTQIPDGTITGGNARGANSFDFQFARTTADKVTSGARSVAFGQDNKVFNSDSYAFGSNITIDGTNVSGYAFGQLHAISASYAIALGGYQHTSTATYTVTFGNAAKTQNMGQMCYGLSRGNQPAIAGNGIIGEAQYSFMGWRGTTINNTATELFLMGNIPGLARAVLQDKTAWSAEIDIVARSSTGTDVGIFKRRLLIKRETGAVNTVLVGSVQTSANGLPEDITSTANAASWGVTLSANTTYGCLSLSVTGNASANVYWVAKLSTVEVMF